MTSTFVRRATPFAWIGLVAMTLTACAGGGDAVKEAAPVVSESSSPTSSPEPTWEPTPCDTTSTDEVGEFFAAPVILDETETMNDAAEVVPGKYLLGVDLKGVDRAPEDLIATSNLTAAYTGNGCEPVDVLSVSSLGVTDVGLDGIWLVEVDSDVKLRIDNGGMVFALESDLVESGRIGIGATYRSQHLNDLNYYYKQPA
ncbi:hypothetical protein ACSAGD_11675 [Paramicrobacterium sp. CJ85]|uniref:hypothetical protein n=1 Tax=Paramicrobacterium sp. CJ85 TaxID=3445355 RepID=UPI003F62584E